MAIIRVDTSKVKRSIKTRTALTSAMEKQIAQSTFYQNDPEAKAECDGLITLGKALAASDADVAAKEAAAADARTKRDADLVAYDQGLGSCAAKVQQRAKTPGDVTSIAMTPYEDPNNKFEKPLAMVGKYSRVTELLRVDVKLPPGVAACIVEVTTTPGDPASWKRLKGNGKRRVLSGYGPGEYYFRAASVRASEESDFCDPIAVVVK